MKKIGCILLVDDDRATNFLNQRLLRKLGVAEDIRVCHNGAEAMEYLEKAAAGEGSTPRPEIILLDINMPLVNGWEFLDRYSNFSINYKKDIIIVMLTTSLRETDRKMAEQYQFVRDLVHKPLLPATVERIWEQYFPEGEAA